MMGRNIIYNGRHLNRCSSYGLYNVTEKGQDMESETSVVWMTKSRTTIEQQKITNAMSQFASTSVL